MLSVALALLVLRKCNGFFRYRRKITWRDQTTGHLDKQGQRRNHEYNDNVVGNPKNVDSHKHLAKDIGLGKMVPVDQLLSIQLGSQLKIVSKIMYISLLNSYSFYLNLTNFSCLCIEDATASDKIAKKHNTMADFISKQLYWHYWPIKSITSKSLIIR